MIRKLHEADRAQTVALLQRAPEQNLYALGNLAVLGFEVDFCAFFGEFDGAGRLIGVCNRYFNGWTVYGLEGADWAALAALIESGAGSERLQDNPGGVPSLLPWLRTLRAEQVDVETLMALDAGALVAQPAPAGIVVRQATLADLPALAALYRDAGRMSRTLAGVERPLRDTRVFVAERAGAAGRAAGAQLLSAALTNAETAELAMIGGVYTLPAQRGRGLAQAVVSALCAELQADGKRPVLYWEAADAGAIYAKLGFHTIGAWRAVRLAPVGGG